MDKVAQVIEVKSNFQNLMQATQCSAIIKGSSRRDVVSSVPNVLET